MDFRHLRTFIEVSEKQSFSKAAVAMGYTQAAVTIQIQKLEDFLGVRLFERMPRHIALTAAGEAFVDHAKCILNAVAKAVSFNTGKVFENNIIRIGVVACVAYSQLPSWIVAFHEIYPKIELKVIISPTSQLKAMLQHNEIDIMITFDQCEYEKDLDHMGNMLQSSVFVSADKTLVNQYHELSDLKNRSFFLTEKGGAYRSQLDNHLAMVGLELNHTLETTDIRLILEVLKRSTAIAFLPEFAVQKHINQGDLYLVRVNMPQMTLSQQIIMHKKKQKTPALLTFLNIMMPQTIE